MLKFNPENHEYTWDGVKMISVTQLVEKYGFSDVKNVPEYILRPKGSFGDKAHKAIALAIRRRLNYDALHPKLRPYVDKALEIVKDYEIIEVEYAHCRPELGFAGTMDFMGKSVGPEIIDWKTGNSLGKGVQIQLSLYEILANDLFGLKYKAKAIKLPEGKIILPTNESRQAAEYILYLENYRRKK